MLGELLIMATLLQANAAGDPLEAVPFTEVRITDTFWAPRIQTNREKTLPANFKWCEDTGRIRNFEKASGKLSGEFEGLLFNDSDVYKVIEGAAYVLHQQPDPALETYVDGIIEKIAAAQQPDGYLNTYFTLKQPERRWKDLKYCHELYCAGHLTEAAVAYYRATGKRTLLDVACKFNDYIGSVFGPDKRHGLPGHEELELALVKLYQVTNEQRYLDLATYFINERGNAEGHELFGDYCQDHIPIRKQSEIAGHAVRAMYLYSGVADVARLTHDDELVAMMERVWQDVATRKMYVTGGIGPSAKNEGFTVAYDLPNDSAYAETCASIGMVFWNQRMALLTADAQYADVMERALYNGLLSGVALDGEKFFYVNPLASRGLHHRQSWFDCACCPSNLVRFLPSLGGYLYATNGNDIFVNLYAASTAKVTLKSGTVDITQDTQYPWDGKIKLTFTSAIPANTAVNLRIPGWCATYAVQINGAEVKPVVEKGYARLEYAWQSGNVIELNLDMPVLRLRTNPHVTPNLGRIALQRGPIVYCLEAVDNHGHARNLAIDPSAEIAVAHRPDLLNGVTVLTGKALAREPENWNNVLYQPAGTPQEVSFTAIPYYAWDNREPGEMVVWVPESIGLAEAPAHPTLENTSKLEASHCQGTLEALCDGIEPATSNDQGIPRFTWWDRRGTQEWVQYTFSAATVINGMDVFWFDDRDGGGQCRIPAEWTLDYLVQGEWKPVPNPSAYGVVRDRFNHVAFDTITAEGLRINVKLAPKMSGGILEWKITKP